MSKYGVFSGSHFPKFGLNTGQYGPEKTPYLDIFHALNVSLTIILLAALRKDKFFPFCQQGGFQTAPYDRDKLQELINYINFVGVEQGFSLRKLINFCFREKRKLAVFKISELDEKQVQGMVQYQLPFTYIGKQVATEWTPAM